MINLEVRNGEISLINGLAPALPPPLLAAGRARCEAEGLEGLGGTSAGPRAGVWSRAGIWPCCTPPAPAPPGGGCWQGMGLGRGEGHRLKIPSCIPWVSHPMFTQVFWWLIAQPNSLSIFFSLWCKVFHARSCRFGGNSASLRSPQLRQVWLIRTMGLIGAKRGRGASTRGRLAAGGGKAKPKTNKPKSTPKPVNNTNKPQLPSRFIGKAHDSQGLALNFLHLYLESGCWVPSSTTAVPHSFGRMFNILWSNIHKMGRERGSFAK